MDDYVKGDYKLIYKDKGIKYKLYVPENVNADTPVFIYAYGAGDPNIEKCIAEQGSNAIIIGTCIDFNADIGPMTMDIVNEVKQKYGVTSTNVSTSSFSLGGSVIYEIAAENIKQNPDCDPQTVFLIDAYGTYFYNPKLHLEDTETMNLFKENNTIFFAFDLAEKTTNVNTMYAEAGLNLITVKCIGQGHGEINTSVFANGIYDYRTNEKLPKDGYIYSIYNKEAGQWEEIPYEKVATLQDIYSLFGIETDETIEYKYTLQEMANLEDLAVTSDSGVLEASLNKIRGVIRSTNIVSSGYTDSGCSSTTMMPSQIGAVVSRFIQSTTSCLSKIVNETAQFAAIGESIEDMNFNLERAAMEIDDIDLVRAVYGSMSSVTEEDVKQEYMEATDSTIPTNEIVEEKEQPVSTDSTVNNVETNYDVIEKDTVSDEKTDDVTKPDIVVPSYNNSTSGGNSGNSNNSGSSNKPAINPGSISAGALIGGSSVPSNNTIDTSGSKDIKEEMKKFISYDELLSDDNKLVYECGDGCKLVIYKDGDKVVGVEYFFDLKKSNATLEQLKTRFENVEHFQEIINENNNAKVFLDVKVFDDKSLEDIKKMFDEMDGYEMV
jgi:arsenate reductase-like glutaredoxin family protein